MLEVFAQAAVEIRAAPAPSICLLLNMSVSFLSDRRRRFGSRCDFRCTAGGCSRAAAINGRREIGFGQPEIAFCVDGQQDRVDLLPAVGEQFERVGDHAIVGEQRLLLDLRAQRHDAVAVVPGDIVVRAVGLDRQIAPPSGR